jgi:hypothetical protein
MMQARTAYQLHTERDVGQQAPECMFAFLNILSDLQCTLRECGKNMDSVAAAQGCLRRNNARAEAWRQVLLLRVGFHQDFRSQQPGARQNHRRDQLRQRTPGTPPPPPLSSARLHVL